MRPVTQAEKSGGGKLMFEDEMRALHAGGSDTNTEVMEEFEAYFSGLVGDVERNTEKYAAAMRQLEELLALECETELIRRKVAAFTLDYDDDLVIILTKNVVRNLVCTFFLPQNFEPNRK